MLAQASNRRNCNAAHSGRVKSGLDATRSKVLTSNICILGSRFQNLSRQMLFTPRSRSPILSAAFILLIATCFQVASGQAQEIGDGENDPVKLFDRGQDAHAKGDYKTAIQFYEAAVK